MSGEYGVWDRTFRFKVSKYLLGPFPALSCYNIALLCIATVCLSMLTSNALLEFVPQFIIQYAQLVSPNIQHNLEAVNILFDRRYGSKVRIRPYFSAQSYHNEPIFASVPKGFKNPFQLCLSRCLFACVQETTIISQIHFVQHSISLRRDHVYRGVLKLLFQSPSKILDSNTSVH